MVGLKRDIPIELLRRSSRTLKSTKLLSENPKSDELSVKNASVKRESSEDPRLSSQAEPTKRIKSEQECNLSESKSEKGQVATSNETGIEKKPLVCHAEGLLDLDIVELDLERTLLGGQSFRWIKTSDDILSEPIFTGVILNSAIRLWRHSPTSIAFERLNTTLTAPAVKLMLEDYFQTKYKLVELYKDWSQKDKHLAECCKQYEGFRILRQDPVENLFSFICATNNNIKRISQMVDKLCRTFGDILDSCSSKSIYDCYYSFPSVQRLAKDDVFDCLRNQLGFGYRAKFIVETARLLVERSEKKKFGSPRDYLLSLRQLPYKETCKELMQFHGIGRKVADCICLMSMDHLNSVPIDCHIYEIVCRHYMPNLKQERKTLTENVHDLIADHFNKLHGPLSGWSTSVLFIAELKHLKMADGGGGGGESDVKGKKSKNNNKPKIKQ